MIASIPLQLSLWALGCLIVCLTLVVQGFKNKKIAVLAIGILSGIAGVVLAIVSAVKIIDVWSTEPSKTWLVVACVIDSLYLLAIVAIFAFIIWIFIGYRNGL